MSAISLLERYGRPAVRASAVTGLVCRACGQEIPAEAISACDRCWGPLDVRYDYDSLRRTVSRESMASGPASMWRYQHLLPVGGAADLVTLGEGWTPLVHARNLGKELGLAHLYIKNDTTNPTNSFKDRVVSVAVNWARSQGFSTIACASTGNLANAVAAFAAHAGLRAVVFVPADLEPAKVLGTAVYGATIVRVDGTYDDVNRLCVELADTTDWAFCNINVRPFYGEGSKTLTFETVEQLGWRLPDEIIVPIASGCQFVKHARAIDEVTLLGLVDAGSPHPRLTGAQAAGCSPVATAFARGTDEIEPVQPDTIARSIAIGSPSDGADAVRLARRTGGVIGSVGEDEIVEGIRLLAASEGIFAETAGGVVVALLRNLARSGRWSGEETIVAYITGHGLKTAGAVEPSLRVDEPVAPSLRAFRERFAEL
jgi:threonine synthase